MNTKQNIETNFTSRVHRTAYPTIALSRPALRQDGKTVLVTGGATGIGFSIAKSFVQAGAAKVILVGRRAAVLETAVAALKPEAAGCEVLAMPCDQGDHAAVRALWAALRRDECTIDTLVLNAVDFTDGKPLLELGAESLWHSYEVNVRGLLDMVEGLHQQPHRGMVILLNVIHVSSQALNMLYKSQLAPSALYPTYGLTKNAGTMLLQQIAKDVSPDVIQIISFHPGLIHNDQWAKMGVKKTDLPFDDDSLPGSFAVWATTEEARFLHGRFVWASWDIDEYSQGETRRLLQTDDFLRVGVVGLRGAFKADWSAK
ncbi:hypothetical protein ASPZODRAFT_104672 [Penicilliopsis zonata CBS 506.65]|uniref:Ketoreductase domain-containing protein n=1 Tax=Penicilliopsis zonata CBS 506.65 TaxID=1073090 RepID=A0A1L9S663_9EURO|nr:hypothetical protein ASPZODRAFT_104672 [Penicilliopsis zonata CBS 506.65]OJJ42647.1 hypothetical protein ASPZODRAFT_104672 [Penicilliopsis zonata CBS 506.65]